MKTRLFLSLLGFACLLSKARSDCDLTGGDFKTAFPDILKNVIDSYIMGVEFSAPGASQTDYYTENYEVEFKRGRVDGHINGSSFSYIYRSETWEAWNITGSKCELLNITVTPQFFKDAQNDWVHSSGTEYFTTIGPSAMFKVAYDAWKTQSKDKTMAFMGKINDTIRGEKAVFFRRCLGEKGDKDDKGFVDYFFAADEEENAFDVDVFKKNISPLRVAFVDVKGQDKALATQNYDIISFQHQIPSGVEPFELPKGKNCQRGDLADGPKLPDFSNNNMLFSAEVLYKKVSTKDGGYEVLSSYYSTLMFAIDREINHLAYLYSSWNTSKPDKEHEEPFLNAPEYAIYDLTHGYNYRVDYTSAICTISRDKNFSPSYRLPENGGSISLTDPYILFPNNELSYLTKGTDRGLTVNIFETEIKGYVLDAETLVDRAIVTHSYLTENEELENTVAVRSAPTQIQLRFYRKPDIEEVLTFNIFGFTTKLPKRRYLFDLSRCFKNSDDYTYLTLGFEPEERFLPELEKRLSEVEDNVLREVTIKSELNVARIPYVVTDLKNKFIYVTMLILDGPPLYLDFPNKQEGKTIPVKSQDDTQGVSNFGLCAQNCLETRSGCWGFALCGATCYYGSTENVKVEDKAGCNLYTRYNNESFIASMGLVVSNIVNQVEAEEFMTTVTLDSGERVELKATVAQVTDPAEDDSLFEKMGNLLNPRMRVLKAGAKLKKGTSVKNLGKLRYDECQKLCLDFKDCDTLSYCLINGDCKLSSKYGVDLKDDDIEVDDLCNLLTRKYTDHFDRTPGVFVVSAEGGTKVTATTVEDCARECLKQAGDKCLSFDHCAGGEKDGCRLYSTHYLSPSERKTVTSKNPRCGHYSRKMSIEFKKKAETRIVGGSFQIIMNLTMEECAKRCIEYSGGSCYAYDFCQDESMFATSCTLIDSDPSRLKTSYSAICTNYARTAPEYAPRPYSNAYAGGIGFLCFLIGGVVGGVIVFVVAYIRVNRR